MNHSHVLYDSDPHFKIDPISRRIINESSSKTLLIQHDHNSERFTFEIPRYIEGHDMSSCNLVEIHYANVEANTKIVRGGVYTVDDLQVKSDDENTVVCSWLIPNKVTQYVGQLQFLVRFACVNESTAKVEYVWNTAIYSGITVSSGIYNSNTPSDVPLPPYNFVTTVSGDILKFFVGEQAGYESLSGEERNDLLALFTDDTTLEEIEAKLNEMDGVVTALNLSDSKQTSKINDIVNGETVVANANKAENANHATSADHATNADSATNAVSAETAHIVAGGDNVYTINGNTPEKLSYRMSCSSGNEGVYLVTMYNASYTYTDIIYIKHRVSSTSYGCGGKVIANTDGILSYTTISSTENVFRMQIQKIAEGV